jgi:hypothetical protein
VDAFQLAVFHGLMVSKEQNIYGSEDGDDERNACAIQKFAGILGKQLLLMGEEIKKKRRRRRRFELRGGRTQLFPDESDDFLSSQDSSIVGAGGFAVMDDEDEQEKEEKAEDDKNTKKRDSSAMMNSQVEGGVSSTSNAEVTEIKKEGEKKNEVLASHQDRLGDLHQAKKYEWKVQSTNGKGYTRAKRCSRIGCKSRTRVYCVQCNEPFCYKLLNGIGEDDDDEGGDISCFHQHFMNIKRVSKRRMK